MQDTATVHENCYISALTVIMGKVVVEEGAVVMGYRAIDGNSKMEEGSLVMGYRVIDGNITIKRFDPEEMIGPFAPSSLTQT